MKQSLQNYALIAEIIGGIAVVVSLIYVGFQIEQNTSERRAESIRSITQGNRELALVYVNNAEAGIAWHKVLDGKALTRRELNIMSDSVYAHLMLLEETYNAFEAGYVGEDFLKPRTALIEQKILWSKDLRRVYSEMKSAGIFSMKFTDWLDKQLEQSQWFEDGHPFANTQGTLQ